MIVQKDFLSKLKDFGLNSYEAKLWTALLSRGVATAGELSDIANVPRSRSYDVLESLERKGFVVLKLGKPIKYIAVPPSEVIERVKKNIVEESDRQQKMLESIKKSTIIQELNNLHKSGVNTVNTADLTGILKGKNNIISHISSTFKNAQKSICIITTEQGMISEYENLCLILHKAKERKVSIKFLVPQSKKTIILAKEIEKFGTVKFIENSLGRFCIVDGKTLHFFVEDEAGESCVWVNTSFVAGAFENIFNKLWPQFNLS